MPLVELIGSCSGLVSIFPKGVLFLGPLGRDSNAGQCQALHVTSPGLRLKLQSDSPFVAASEGPGYVCEGPICAPRSVSTSINPRFMLAKSPRLLEIHFHLVPTCWAQSLKEILIVHKCIKEALSE